MIINRGDWIIAEEKFKNNNKIGLLGLLTALKYCDKINVNKMLQILTKY